MVLDLPFSIFFAEDATVADILSGVKQSIVRKSSKQNYKVEHSYILSPTAIC